MKKLHLICNAHIDPVWQWTADEGIASAIATFKAACDLSEEFEFIFCHNEALLYEAIEENCPELFERIKKLVEVGKWKIMGGWYIQPDCLMPSGESFIRQTAIGHEYFSKKFGIVPTIATNFDSFGHSIGLVQILKKFGYTGYVATRPKKWEMEYPDGKFYNWVSPSGDSIVFTNFNQYGVLLGEAAEYIEKYAKTAEDIDGVLWGVGNHGGGPSRKDLNDIKNLKIDGVELIHSTLENLFSDDIKISADIKHSLVTAMPGCYTSMSRIKKLHRETENLLYSTEKLLAIASLAGLKIDLTQFYLAQKKLLLAEFHDILPGTTIESGEQNGLEFLNHCKDVIKDYRFKAFMYLTIQEPVAKEGEYPIFVFNPMPYEITTPVEAEYMLANQNWSEEFCYSSVVYCGDTKIESQEIQEESCMNLDWRKKVIFNARLKPMSITRFSIFSEKKPCSMKFEKQAVEANISKFISGTILKDEAVLEMYEDTADPWGMSKDELLEMGKNPQKFTLMSDKESKEFLVLDNPITAVHQVESGNILNSIEAFYKKNNTNAVIEYKKYKDQSYLDLKVTVEFLDKNKMIKLKLPMPEGIAVGDGPFIVEEKPDNCENYYQKWFGVKQKDGKIFAVINDCIHGGHIKDGYMYLTLIRGVGYCMHPIPRYDADGNETLRQLYPTNKYMPRIDSGRYVFNLRIMCGDVTQVSTMSEEFNQKPYSLSMFPISGNRKSVEVFTDVPVNMSTMKISVDGGYVLRFFNPEMQEKSFTLTIQGNSIKITLNKMEVISVKYDNGNFEVLPDKLIV